MFNTKMFARREWDPLFQSLSEVPSVSLGGNERERGGSRSWTYRSAGMIDSDALQFVLDSLFADDIHPLVGREVKDVGKVDGRRIRRAKDLVL